MRVLAIVHERDGGPGVFAEAIAAAGGALHEWFIAEGEPEPGDPLGYDAVMTFGGSMDAHEEERHPWLGPEKELLRALLAAERPLLGVCLGSQLLGEAAGAPAERAAEPEIGWSAVELTDAGARDPLLAPLAPRFSAFQWHSYRSPLPPGAVALARNEVGLQAYRVGGRAWGIQFHAEVTERDALGWARSWHKDPDAVRIGLDHEALAGSIRERIGAWNGLGRELCARFLEAAREPAGAAR